MVALAQKQSNKSRARGTAHKAAAKEHVYDADGFDENGLDENGFTREEVAELLYRLEDLKAGNGKVHELLEPIW